LKLLLDTHLLIWASSQSWLLSTAARELIEDPANELVFSSISIWEVAIKRGLERSDFDVEPRILRRGLIDEGYRELAFTSDHAFAVSSLPLLHKDPFDRALMAQAMSEGLLLLTSDRLLEGYSGLVRRV
jgi:PIN domain nuclease of toxin-antitoxin system